MELKEFVENFDSQTKVRIIWGEEMLFEGNVDILVKLLKAKVKSRGCERQNDSIFINVSSW